VVQEDIVHLLWGLGPREGREALLGMPVSDLLAVQRLWGVAVSREEDQCLFLVALIALKYPAFEVPATSRMCGVLFFPADLTAL